MLTLRIIIAKEFPRKANKSFILGVGTIVVNVTVTPLFLCTLYSYGAFCRFSTQCRRYSLLDHDILGFSSSPEYTSPYSRRVYPPKLTISPSTTETSEALPAESTAECDRIK